MLPGVEIVVTAMHCKEFRVLPRSTMTPLLDNENLIGAADRGRAVSDHECGAALHKLVEAVLNHGFRFGVERAGGLVEDENARLGQQCACDGKPLALAAESLTPRSPTMVS